MKNLLTTLFLGLHFLALQAQFSPAQPIHLRDVAYYYESQFVDLDGDGLPEMLVKSEPDGFGFYPNLGAGEFGQFQWLDQGYDENTVLWGNFSQGDLDGDGDVDMVLSGEDRPPLAFINIGGLQFMPTNLSAQAMTIHSSDLVDVDQDGDLDVVLSGNAGPFQSSWQLYLMYNNGGSLEPMQSIAEAIAGEWGDGDADGDLDLFYHVPGAGVTAYWMLRNDGGAQFTPVFLFDVLLVVWDQGWVGQWVDVDADGDADLMQKTSANPTVIRVLVNQGNATFIPVDVATEQEFISSLYFTDMNGDGLLDVYVQTDATVFTAANAYWLENNGAGGWPTQHSVPPPYDSGLRVDLDGDGLIDRVDIDEGVRWRRNAGAGVFEVARIVIGAVDNVGSLTVADWDGDGNHDALVRGAGVMLHRNQGGGQWDKQVLAAPATSYNGASLLMDMDGDDDLDRVDILQQDVAGTPQQVPQVSLNDGTGSFSVHWVADDPMYYLVGTRGDWLDVNGDVLPDWVVTSNSGVQTWLNDGTGAFSMQVTSPPDPAAISFITRSHAADINGDGFADLVQSYMYEVTPNSFALATRWFTGDGAGGFTHQGPFAANEYNTNYTLFGDLNGDGAADMVHPGGPDGFAYVVLNNGDATFAAPVPLSPGVDVDLGLLPGLLLDDADGDGDLDLLASFMTPGKVFWRLNDGTGDLTDEVVVCEGAGTEPRGIAVGDIDNDGRKDVVVLDGPTEWTSYARSRLVWYEQFLNAPFSIEGTVFLDANENGVQDGGEQGLPYFSPAAQPLASVALSDANGAYTIMADEEGAYQVQMEAPGALWQFTTPGALTPSVSAGSPTSTGNDFGLAPSAIATELHLAPVISSAPCNGPLTHFLVVSNIGTTQPSGSICYTVSPLFSFNGSAPAPTSVIGNTVCWDYDQLGFFESISIAVELTGPSWFNSGQPIVFTLVATEEDGSGNVLQTFTTSEFDNVACPYDPNDKQVEPEGYGDAGAIDIDTEYLEYRIRFQNTGNAPAASVELHDRLHEALDLSSMQVMGFSHAPTSVMIEEDRKLLIRFAGINLPDSAADLEGSQGYFLFRIRLEEGLPSGTEIENTASIFFDYNPAVITNTTITTLIDCDLWSVSGITQPDWNYLQAPTGDNYQWYLDGSAIPGATDEVLFFAANGSYTVEVTSEFGCTGTSDPYAVISTALPETGTLSMALIPNPFADRAEAVFSKALTSAHTITLVDLNGRTVRSFQANGARRIGIDRGGLAAGLYTLLVMAPEGQVASARFVIEP